ALDVIAVLAPGLALIAQRVGETETEQTERREPFDADAGRDAQLAEVEAVVDREAGLVGELRVAEEVGLAEVDERRQARAAPEFLGQRQDGCELAAQGGVATERIAERVARA